MPTVIDPGDDDGNCQHEYELETKKATGKGGKSQTTLGVCIYCLQAVRFSPTTFEEDWVATGRGKRPLPTQGEQPNG